MEENYSLDTAIFCQIASSNMNNKMKEDCFFDEPRDSLDGGDQERVQLELDLRPGLLIGQQSPEREKNK
jgi:hypothetical protein